jgi:hypothetical protein
MKMLEKVVKRYLEQDENTRGSDDILYCEVIEGFFGYSLDDLSAKTFLLNYRKCRLPTVETVGRCRRRLQAQYPELKPTHDVEVARRKCEKTFFDYSLNL